MKEWIVSKLGIGLISLLLLSVLFLISCTFRPFTHHDITINQSVCITPYSRYTYKTGGPLTVVIDGEEWIIPKDFETDLASIPRWYWTFLAPQYSAFVEPSILHDYFYRCANLKDRKFADDVFYYALINEGVSRATASKFYFAVRVFGAHSYSKTLQC